MYRLALSPRAQTGTMLWRVVCSVALGLWLGSGETGARESSTVEKEVDDIFRTVQRYMSQDSKTVEARVKENIHSDQRESGELEDVGPRPVAFPIGLVTADSLYPLVVGKNVDTGKPFVTNLNRQHALVVARTGESDYRLLIPFPVVMRDVDPAGYARPAPQQSYRQEPDKRPPPVYSKPYYKNAKLRPEKVFHAPYLGGSESGNRGYNGVYSKQGVYHSPTVHKPNPPRTNIPIAYRQPQNPYDRRVPATPAQPLSAAYPPVKDLNYDRRVAATPAQPLSAAYPPVKDLNYDRRVAATPAQPLYPPVNYAGAYASVPKDFRPSPYLGNITDDPRPVSSSGGYYESYDDDDKPYTFTEQDYLDSMNSPDAQATVGGVHHITHHVDDYLGKIYEEMYYKTPPPHIDRQGKQDPLPDSYEMKAKQINNSNKTETSRPKTLVRTERRPIKMGSNKTNFNKKR